MSGSAVQLNALLVQQFGLNQQSCSTWGPLTTWMDDCL